jgi:thiol-disulfide isomerase/thioredoxin
VRLSTLARRLLPAIGILTLVPIAGSAAPQKKTPAPVVTTVDGPGLKKALEAYRGKVVVLNLWATWCAPCVAEFPDLVKLHHAYQDRGVTVVAVSVDDPNAREKVRRFLTAQKATFPAYLRKSGDMEAFINAVSPNWSGAVPATFLFDRNGRQIGAPLIGAHSFAKFAAAVEPLL